MKPVFSLFGTFPSPKERCQNDRPMNTMEDFEEAVKEANRSSDRILWIRAVTQSGRLRSAVVELDEK